MEFFFDDNTILQHKEAKEFCFRLPSGHVIPIPNFYKTLDEQKQNIIEMLAKLNGVTPEERTPPPTVGPIEFMVPEDEGCIGYGFPFVDVTISENGRSREFEIYCDILTGTWIRFMEFEDNLFERVVQLDNRQLLTRLQTVEARLQTVERENARLRSWHEHIAERQQTWNEFNAIANEMTTK